MTASIDPEGRERDAIHALVDFRDASVLEIGAGDGRLTFRYAEQVARVLALEPVGSSVRLAKRLTPRHLRGKVRFVKGDATSYGYPSSDFDVAVLAHSL